MGQILCAPCHGIAQCCEYAIYGPSWNSWRDRKKKPGKPGVVCVAGLASSALEVHTPTCWDCLGLPKYWVSYCSISSLASTPMQTLDSLSLKLVDGKNKNGDRVKCTESTRRVRPVQGTAGISTLNPGEQIPISVWKGLLDPLEKSINFYALNYDWRRWGDEVYAETIVENFKKVVKRSQNRKFPKSAVIAHSMGAPVVLYCLGALGERWVRNNISQVILVAPAHVGSPCMIPSYGHGPVGTTASWVPVPDFLEKNIGDLAGTWACMISEMPVAVGGVAPWDPSHVFARTPTKKYTLNDMGTFLEDLSKCTDKRPMTALWDGFLRLAAKMTAPPVPTKIIYGAGEQTIVQVRYESEDLVAAPYIEKSEPGDNTITASSIEAVANAWKKQDRDVELLKVEGSVAHKELIQCEFTINAVKKALNIGEKSSGCFGLF